MCLHQLDLQWRIVPEETPNRANLVPKLPRFGFAVYQIRNIRAMKWSMRLESPTLVLLKCNSGISFIDDWIDIAREPISETVLYWMAVGYN